MPARRPLLCAERCAVEIRACGSASSIVQRALEIRARSRAGQVRALLLHGAVLYSGIRAGVDNASPCQYLPQSSHLVVKLAGLRRPRIEL